ncbi:serine/threonine protein kinase [candidate division KSB1 bacterium]|nr:serine/threonine protein kinase [candidate division KSB1 bacterium]
MELSQIIDGNYKILKYLKSGGFGIVHIGWDITLERPVAIKEIHEFLFDDELIIRMFQDEAKNTAQLNHPNIVHVYSLRKTEKNRFYIIMEYIDGLDLLTIIKRLKDSKKRIPKETAVAVILHICKALDYAHTKKDDKTDQELQIVHRDISPSNIMISKAGIVKLIDFGIAKARFRSIEKSGLGFVKGKLPYMSPEQVEGKTEVDYRTDLFSLGVVFFELLSNEKLFKSEHTFTLMKDVSEVKIDPKRINSLRVPDEIKEVIFKCLKKDPAERFQAANDIIPPLEDFLDCDKIADPSKHLKEFMAQMTTKDDTIQTIMSMPLQEIKTTDRTEIVKTQIISDIDVPPDQATTPIQSTHLSQQGTSSSTVIVQDSARETETERTIFDIVRLSSRTYKKQIIASLVGLSVAFLIFIGFDTFYNWTSIGKFFYNSFFPPSILVGSKPVGANVYLDGDFLGITNQAAGIEISKIKPGSHELRLTLDGYSPVIMALEVPPRGAITQSGQKLSKRVNVRFDIPITITSNPPGATIYINGDKSQFETPHALTDWPIGEKLAIELHKNGFEPLKDCNFDSETGKLNGADKRIWELDKTSNQAISYVIEGSFYKPVVFRSSPSGANVYIDSETAPVANTGSNSPVRLTIGSYKVLYQKDSFIDRSFSVEINEDTPKEIWQELNRTVSIRAVDAAQPSTEINATVRSIYNDRNQHFPVKTQTPAQFEFEYVDNYVTLQKATYKDTTVLIRKTMHSVTVAMNHMFIMRLNDRSNGEPISEGQILFKAVDPDLGRFQFYDVIHDGKSERTLPPGNYVFKIVAKNYLPFERDILINYKATNSIDLLLDPIPEHFQEVAPDSIQEG